jgi:ribonuclease-3
MKPNPIKTLEKLIKIKFKNGAVLEQALIHRSYLNENKTVKLQSNERYEFLGDAILELWVSDQLFHLFPDYNEGNLTNLRALVVCTQNLAKIASSFNLGQFLSLSKGEEANGGRNNQSILANTFEALIGSIYLDKGLKPTYKFLDKFVNPSLLAISQQKIFKDPKSLFQEIAQAEKGITPHYQTIEESGPDHQKIFKVAVLLGDHTIASGSGNSKQKAEEAAATAATKIFTKNSV